MLYDTTRKLLRRGGAYKYAASELARVGAGMISGGGNVIDDTRIDVVHTLATVLGKLNERAK